MRITDKSTARGSRKQAIQDAGVRVLAERGLAGLTHRATDEAAGLPSGSCTYYFPKKSALIAGVAERLSERLEQDSMELRAGFADLVAAGRREEAVELVTEALCACAEDERAVLLARTEVSLAAARDLSYRAARDRMNDAARSPIAFYLRLLAGEPGEEAIQTCAGLIDGLLLAYVTGQGPAPTSATVAALCSAVLPDAAS